MPVGRALVALAVAISISACTPADERPTTQPAPSLSEDQDPVASPSPEPQPEPSPSPNLFEAKLTGSAPCSDLGDFTCSTLKVPVDYSKPKGAKLRLQVAVANGSPRRDVLLFLTGGPGQAGVSFAPIVADQLAPLLDEYRLVMIDQRGTGDRAIECPELQGAVGASDLLTASPSAVRACAKIVGRSRGFYTTADTVADLDVLRRALRAQRWVVDGVSYGSFVAQRYAIAHPNHVRGLVLDSVIPPDGIDTFLRVNLRRSSYVLRDVCREDPPCLSDPAKDLAKVVRAKVVDNVNLLNALTLQSIVDPSFREMADAPGLLGQAAEGDASGLEEYIERFRVLGLFTAEELSAGAHVATLCSDLRFPWGDAATPIKQRRRALVRAVRRIKEDRVWPFDRKTAASQGMIKSCLEWPPVPTQLQLGATDLPDIPVLLLHGERDLSTPMAWAREAARAWPNSRLVEISNDGHSVHSDGTESLGGRALTRFLRDL